MRLTMIGGNKGTPSAAARRMVAAGQGGYYLLTGVWPLLHMPSFELITGRKTDRWLVQTVGVLIGVIGAVQLAAVRRNRPDDVRSLSVGVALGLAAVEYVHWRRGTISLVYALDALLEVAFAVAWLGTSTPPARLFRPRRSVRPATAWRGSPAPAPQRVPARGS